MRKLMGVLVALGILLSVLAASTPAGAWQHNVGQLYTYRAPGPPPGPPGNHCDVKTKLFPSASDAPYGWAYINMYHPPSCVAVCVQAVYYYAPYARARDLLV